MSSSSSSTPLTPGQGTRSVPRLEEERAGLDPAAGGPFSFTTLPLREVEELVDFVLWDTPTSMIPTPGRVCRLMAELLAREDAGHPVVAAAIAEAWRFLDLDGAARH